MCFEQMSGHKIDFHISELYLFGDATAKADTYKHIFTYDTGSLAMKYLGIPVMGLALGILLSWNATENSQIRPK